MNGTILMQGTNPKLEELQNFLNENFDFRYNVLTDMPECKPKNTIKILKHERKVKSFFKYGLEE